MEKEAYQQRSQRLFLIGLATVMDEWMDAIKCSNVESWNVALATWLVVSSNEHVDTAENDDEFLDELDGMETRAYIFDKRGFTTMDDIATFKSMHATATFTIMDGDAMAAATKNTMTQRHLLILCDPLVGIWKERKHRKIEGRKWRLDYTHVSVSKRSCSFCHITLIKASLFIC
ncbi:predicted protein [Lichtheimia corymbifera JMRC:FSU:9682]|uniref:Uncharacterized protein n=1 Tax=Lichtheimia corymbifera JMRC:FSU:9682 TaxID=1263082 RepID=A0A068S205_9FUNG|nr:predicted protein [Lichtheimia corymbifera JMRC:FSU:9682]